MPTGSTAGDYWCLLVSVDRGSRVQGQTADSGRKHESLADRVGKDGSFIPFPGTDLVT